MKTSDSDAKIEASKGRLAILVQETVRQMNSGEKFPRGRVGAIRKETASFPREAVQWFFSRVVKGIRAGNVSAADAQDLTVLMFGKAETLKRLAQPMLLREQVQAHYHRRELVDDELAMWVADPQEEESERERERLVRQGCAQRLTDELYTLGIVRSMRPEVDDLEDRMEAFDASLGSIDKEIRGLQKKARDRALSLSALREIHSRVTILQMRRGEVIQEATPYFHRLQNLQAGMSAAECDLGVTVVSALENMRRADIRLAYVASPPQKASRTNLFRIRREAGLILGQRLTELAQEVRAAKRPLAIQLPGGPMRLRRHHADVLEGIAERLMERAS